VGKFASSPLIEKSSLVRLYTIRLLLDLFPSDDACIHSTLLHVIGEAKQLGITFDRRQLTYPIQSSYTLYANYHELSGFNRSFDGWVWLRRDVALELWQGHG